MTVTLGTFDRGLATDLEVLFERGRESMSSGEYKAMLRVKKSRSKITEVVFYGDKGRLQRFRGERKGKGIYEYSSKAHYDKWEYTEVVDNEVMYEDQTGGILREKVGNFTNVIPTSLEAESYELLRLGSSRKCFTKANLFDFSHAYVDTQGNTVSSSTWSNMNLAGLGVSTSTILQAQRYFSTTVESDTGKPLGGRLTHVLVGRASDNALAAKEIANSQFTVQSNTVKGQNTVNTFKGAFNIIESDYIGSSEWFAFDLSDMESKPLVLVEHPDMGIENMQYTQLLEDSTTGFWRDQLAFGVKGLFDFNVGDPRSCYLFGMTQKTFTVTDLERQRPVDPNA